MNRRHFIGTVAAGTASLAGCSGLLGSGGSSDDGNGSDPAEVASALFEAMSDGDVAAANELMHSEAPAGEVTASRAETYQSADAKVESATVTSSGEDEATVELEISVETSSGDRETIPFELAMRTENGQWRVYEDTSSSGSESAPSVEWEIWTGTNDDDQVNAVEFTVLSGDSIDPATLSVQVGGQEATVSDPPESLSVGDTVAVSFGGAGESISGGTMVRLVWTAPGGDSSTALATSELWTGTAGPLDSTLQIEH